MERKSAAEEIAELNDRGYEAFKQGDLELSLASHAEALRTAEGIEDAGLMVKALTGLMRCALRESDWDELEHLATRTDALANTTDDESLRRPALHMRAEAARMRGELELARQLYEESIALNQRLGFDSFVAIERGNLAWVELAQGQLDEAERLFAAMRAVMEDGSYAEAVALLGLARVALERGDPSGAGLLAESDSIMEEASLVWDPAEQPEYDRTAELAASLSAD